MVCITIISNIHQSRKDKISLLSLSTLLAKLFTKYRKRQALKLLRNIRFVNTVSFPFLFLRCWL